MVMEPGKLTFGPDEEHRRPMFRVEGVVHGETRRFGDTRGAEARVGLGGGAICCRFAGLWLMGRYGPTDEDELVVLRGGGRASTVFVYCYSLVGRSRPGRCRPDGMGRAS